MRRLCSHLSVRQLLSIRDGSRVIELRKCDFSSNLPVIEIPKYLEPQLKTYRKRVEKEEQRLIERKQRSGIRSIPIITSAQKSQYNHYYGQTYVDPDKTIMVSDGWKSGARKGDRIVFHAYSKNPHYVKQFGATESLSNNPFDSNVSWNQIGLSAELLTALHVLLPHAKHMSNIQQLAIPAIQSGANVMLCAETGSGKTLAYAIPLLEAVVQTKRFQDSSATKKRSPRALIVVPSRELAIQTGQVLRTLADPIGVGCSVLVGGEPMQQSQSGFDIVITTIGLVQQHVRRGVYSLRTCRHLVIDEADTLLDDTFDFNLFDLLGNFKVSFY